MSSHQTIVELCSHVLKTSQDLKITWVAIAEYLLKATEEVGTHQTFYKL